MTDAPQNPEDLDGDDLLAAEYALGVLQGDERQQAARRIESDLAFASLVDAWEALLSPLAADYPEVAPPASVKEGLDLLLYADRVLKADPEPKGKRRGLLHSLGFWRGLAGACLAALLLAIILPLTLLQEPDLRLVAALESAESDVRYLAVYDADEDRISLSRSSGTPGPDQVFELWKIDGDAAPVSLGVLPSGEQITLGLVAESRDRLGQGMVLAISIEPEGGSPTGQPTGPVVAVGALQAI